MSLVGNGITRLKNKYLKMIEDKRDIESNVELLRSIREISYEGKKEKFGDLYNIMKKESFAFMAHYRLKKNKGVNTAGVDELKIDGFGRKNIEEIVKQIRNGTYKPEPVKIVNIPKPGKETKRFLGIPSLKDRIVQQMVYEILEAIYEPEFKIRKGDLNYGFRKGKSIRKAIKKIHETAQNTKWCIEGDIKGAYDNVNHGILLNILQERIKDQKLIKLIKNMLKSGRIENKKYEETTIGTPQGGILSPLLFNIYMSKLDEFWLELKSEEEEQNKKEGKLAMVRNPEYVKLTNEIGKRTLWIRKKEKNYGDVANWKLEDLRILKTKHIEIKEINKKRLKTNSTLEEKMLYRMSYIRYANDWVIFLNGDLERAKQMKERIKTELWKRLKLKLNEEKTKITNLKKNRTCFLGFSMGYPTKGPRVVRTNHGKSRRTTGARLRIGVDTQRIIGKLRNEGFLNEKNRVLSKKPWTVKSDYEIVQNFNWVIRGLVGFWSQGVDFYSNIHRYICILEFSCKLTLAHKRKTTVGKINKKYSTNIIVTKETKQGKKKIKLCGWRQAVELFRQLKEKKYETDNDDLKVFTNWPLLESSKGERERLMH